MGTIPLDEVGTIPICLIQTIQASIGSKGLGFEIEYYRYGYGAFPSAYIGTNASDENKKLKKILFKCSNASKRQDWIRQITLYVEILNQAKRGIETSLAPLKLQVSLKSNQLREKNEKYLQIKKLIAQKYNTIDSIPLIELMILSTKKGWDIMKPPSLVDSICNPRYVSMDPSSVTLHLFDYKLL